MTEVYTGGTEGGALDHLIQRSHAFQTELRARREAIDSGDPEALANLRQGLRRYMLAVPENQNLGKMNWWHLRR